MPADPTVPAPIGSPLPADPPTTPIDPWPAPSIQDEMFRQSLDAIVLTDLDFHVRNWNPAAERLYGIPATEAIGRRMGELLDTFDLSGEPLDGSSAADELKATGAWRRRVVQRPRIGHLAGESVTVDSLVAMLRAADGAPLGTFGVNRDVTVPARLEAELAALGSLVVATGRARTTAEVAQAAIDILVRASGADAGLVTSMDGGYEAIARVGVRQETVDVIVNDGQLGGPLARALQAADAYVSADVATAPLREDVRAAVAADGIDHLVVIGLRLADRLTGILALGWRRPGPQEPSRPILQQAAALIASALENARLIAAVEAGLEDERVLARRMRALVELTRLPETAATDRGVDRLMHEVASIIVADASIYAESDGDRLRLVYADRVERGDAEPLVNRPIADLPFMHGLAQGAAALLFPLATPAATAEGTASGRSRGFRSVAAFAIREDGAPAGVVLAMFRRPIDQLAIDERTLDSIGRVLDISFANRRLRQGLLASEERYRDLFQASPDALLVESHDTVIDANRAARILFGDDVIGHPIRDLYIGEYQDIDREAIGPNGVGRFVGLGRRLDGSTFPEEVAVRPIEIAGEPRALTIVRDLTERSRLQAELVQAQKMEAIGMLVAGVAHELNNPLASIVAFSQLIRTDPGLPDDLRLQADLLIQESNRTKVIVQNLLDFARQRPPERAEFELRPIVDSVISLQSYFFSRNELSIEIDIPSDLPRLSIDRSQIQQVLINLTLNAAQAIQETGRPGRIRVVASRATSDSGPRVRISIADDGPGVADAMRDRLFVPFATTKEPGRGTGLGLSVSFGIVAGHGGTLRYEPTPGGGSTFTLDLPEGSAPTSASPAPRLAVDPATAATDRPTAGANTEIADGPATWPASGPATGSDGTSGDGRRVRILVLDDEASIREFLARVLARRGFEPVLAATGQAAVEIVRTEPPAAILCDHRMAGMNGTEFHAAVDAIDPALARRFAFMSGDVLNSELNDFATAHGIHLLAKPFDIATAAEMVDRLLSDEA